MMEWTPERIRAFWDYESQFPENYFSYQVGDLVARAFADVLDGVDRVLDYGCGGGHLIRHLLEAGHRVAGADNSPDSLARTREACADHDRFLGAFTIGDLLANGERWPALICCEVIEHLDDSTLEGVVGAMHALLEDGGVAIVTTPNEEDLTESHLLCPVSGEVFHRWQHVRSWSAKSLTAYFEQRGFEPIAVKAMLFAHRPNPTWTQRLRSLVRPEQVPAKLPHLTGVFRRRA
jgi:2-polyprenyl-3-methyl-5-hydroxy-6-metoxy-1,4-benzoquinol methylase